MKIGIDIDEVVVEFVKGYLKFYEKESGKKYLFDNVSSYNFWEVLDFSKEEAYGSVNRFFETEDFEKLDLIDGVNESIGELSENNDIFFITSRPNFINGKTKEFLNRNFPEVSFELIHSKGFDTQRKHKEEICLDRDIKIMIEDNYEYAKKCADKGINVFLLDKPWNKSSEEHKNITRVKHWNEILEQLK